MKRQIFTLLFAFAAVVGTVSAAGKNSPIPSDDEWGSYVSVTDNSIDEWDNLPVEYVSQAFCPSDAALLGLKSVKVYADRAYINILVEPNMDIITDLEWVPFHIYLNTDNSDATGGYSDQFTDANADIMLEGSVFAGEPYPYNPAVFKWWGEVGGSGWEWVDPSVEHDGSDFWGAIVGEGQLVGTTSQFVDGKIEIQILRELVPTPAGWNTEQFGIGFDILQNWSSVGLLPQDSPTDDNPSGHTGKLQVRIDDDGGSTTPVGGNATEIDGIYYKLIDATHSATVVGVENGRKIVIPQQVIYDHTIYDVTDIEPNAFEGLNNPTVFVPRSLSSEYINSWNRYWIYDRIDGDFVFQHAEGEIGVSKDPKNVDLETCDNIVKRCWHVDVSFTQQGTYYHSDYYTWETEYEVVSVFQEELQKIETEGSDLYSDVHVTYALSDFRTQESCYGESSDKNYPRLLSEPTGWYLIGYLGDNKEITLPEKVNGEVYGIGKGGVFEGTNLTSIVLPAGLTSIGADAFYGCTELASIIIPGSVTRIGDCAFYNCKSLTSIVIPNSVTKMGNMVLYGCTGLTSISISANVPQIADEYYAESIGGGYRSDYMEYGGQEFPNLRSVEAPAWFFDAPEPLWMYCPKTLEQIVVNNGELTENALVVIRRSTRTLQKVDAAAATNAELADEAFSGLYNVQALTLPASLQRVNYMAVAGCKNLQSIVIPASVEEIDQSAFEDCRSIRTIQFGNSQPAAVPGRSARDASASHLRKIGNWAFYNAHELQHLDIPEGVEEIGDAAFYGCTYLTDLVLPASVRAIGDNCFALCSKLSKIVVSSPEPPEIQAKTFYDVKRRIPVYVPDESVDTYKGHNLWGEFDIQALSTMEDALAYTLSTGTPMKMFVGGQLYILHGGKAYTLTGAEVK